MNMCLTRKGVMDYGVLKLRRCLKSHKEIDIADCVNLNGSERFPGQFHEALSVHPCVGGPVLVIINVLLPAPLVP